MSNDGGKSLINNKQIVVLVRKLIELETKLKRVKDLLLQGKIISAYGLLTRTIDTFVSINEHFKSIKLDKDIDVS